MSNLNDCKQYDKKGNVYFTSPAHDDASMIALMIFSIIIFNILMFSIGGI